MLSTQRTLSATALVLALACSAIHGMLPPIASPQPANRPARPLGRAIFCIPPTETKRPPLVQCPTRKFIPYNEARARHVDRLVRAALESVIMTSNGADIQKYPTPVHTVLNSIYGHNNVINLWISTAQVHIKKKFKNSSKSEKAQELLRKIMRERDWKNHMAASN